MSDDDRRTVAEVLAEDPRQREREAAARDEAAFDAYMGQAFGLKPLDVPSKARIEPAADKDLLDLHAGVRRTAPGEDPEFEAYMATFPGGERAAS